VQAFVTGGTGLIGRPLVEALIQRNWEVAVLAREPTRAKDLEARGARIVQGDVTRPGFEGAMSRADIVFHAAGWLELGIRDVQRMFDVNLLGTRNVLSMARQQGVGRFVFTSTAGVFAPTPKDRPATESSPVQVALSDPYVTSKVQAHQLVAVAAGLEVPPTAGHVLPRPDGGETARATEGAPFVLQVTVPAAAAALLAARLEAAGAVAAGPATLELSRILAGWPRLGAEVDDRTIPQEARLDQIGGVSYTKGCYTGQETVARLHFRGHVNRQIRGLLFDPEPPAAPADGWSVVTYVDRDVGRVTSLAFVPETGVAGAGRWIGLALIRREVEPGSVVRAAGRDARVVDLPFAFPIAAPA